ncbi:MAG: extracellular solute-binding protein [Clostridiales bacterium]|jgi:ABC-type glycerol-3-phosphate transport system substrate-binding protein|nr:extracellular solute-binding protein [Clostridiales bacterium]
MKKHCGNLGNLGKSGKLRLGALLVALALAIAAFAGCAGNTAAPSEGAAGSTAAPSESGAGNAAAPDKGAAAGEPVEITWFQGLRGVNPDTDRVINAVEDELNIKFNFVATSDDGDEQRQKLSLMISAGEQVDLATMLFGVNALALQWVKDDVLYSFDDIGGDYPALRAELDSSLYSYLKIDGKRYFRPLPLSPGNRGYVIRKDWLDQLGMGIPTTLDEYYEVLKAFSSNDVDGNGQLDTYGFFVSEPYGSNLFGYIARAFINCGCWGGDWVELADGSITQFVASDAAREAFRFIKKCYDEELFNRSFINEKDAEGKLDDLMVQGRLGIMDVTGVNSLEQRFKDAGVEYDLEYLPPLKTQDGKQGTLTHTSGGWGFHVIPKTCRNPEKVMEFLEWGMTEKGRELTMYGIDGVHFNGFETIDGIKAYNTNRAEMDKDWNTADYGLAHPLSWGGFNYDGGYIPIAENGYNFDAALVGQELWMAREEVGGKFDRLKQMNAPYAAMFPLQTSIDEGVIVEQALIDIEIEGRTKAIVEPAEDFEANWDAMLDNWMSSGGEDLIRRGNEAWDAQK